MIDLQLFCDDENRIIKYRACNPWVAGGWWYATNATLVVRVPTTDPDTSVVDKPFPPAAAIFTPAAGERTPWPERRYCPQCLDEGVVGCDCCGERTCLLCNRCEPTGQVVEAGGDFKAIAVGNHLIDVRQDALIRTLPDVQYVVGVEWSREQANPLPFFFEGGEGRVMGVYAKRGEESHV